MVKSLLLAAISLGLLLLSTSCAPTTVPPPTPAPTPTTFPLSPEAPKTTSPLTAEEVAWQKVVEAAKKEGRVTNYSNKFVGDVGVAISKAFKEMYGIEVELITGRGAEFMERLKSEKRMGRIIGDMHDGSSLNPK